MKKKSAVIILLLILACVVGLAVLYYEPLAYVRSSVTHFEPYDHAPNASRPSYELVRQKRYSWLPGPQFVAESIPESEFEELIEALRYVRWSTDPKTGQPLPEVLSP